MMSAEGISAPAVLCGHKEASQLGHPRQKVRPPLGQ
jgi:hypothetical protein